MKSITEEGCAFANASGGVILIGVDDRNSIKGVKLDNSKRSALQNSLGEISPALQCEFYMVEVEGKSVAVIEVPSGLINRMCFRVQYIFDKDLILKN